MRLSAPPIRPLLGVLCLAFFACGIEPTPEEPRSDLDRLAERLIDELAARDIDAVSVGDFRDLYGDTSELGRHLAQTMISALQAASEAAGRRAPRILDRRRTEETLAEREFESQGLVLPGERRRGGIGGVDALVTGVLVSLPDTVHVSIQVIDFAHDAAILVADEVDLPRTAAFNELEARHLRVRGDPEESLDLDAPYPSLQVARLPEGPKPKKLQIDLRVCGRVEGSVFCLFSIVALDRDRAVSVYGSSRAVLPDGSTAEAAQVQIGRSRASGQRGRAGEDLVQGVPVSGMVRFDGIPIDCSEIVLLEVAVYGPDAEFRQVPINRI